MRTDRAPLTPDEARRRLRQASAACDEQLSFAAGPWLWIGAAVAAGIGFGLSPKRGKELAKLAATLLK
ncbi:hypothetical protein HED60_21880 [Planctomycetales bacterium ZRK34]|nr:hypothetical protein HED60_21880 [Planctomycetales bacterium ZRK34]